MRLPLMFAALSISAPAVAEAPAPHRPAAETAAAASAVARPSPVERVRCRDTRAHFASAGSAWRGQPLAPRKLDELPRGTAYMAVYRTINGCEVPMTVAEYRNRRSR